jgi:hypothetical protein
MIETESINMYDIVGVSLGQHAVKCVLLAYRISIG